MKLLKEHYKTHEGASKRARFENGIAKSEYERGNKAKLYRYTVIEESDMALRNQGISWRVARLISVWGFVDPQSEKKFGLG